MHIFVFLRRAPPRLSCRIHLHSPQADKYRPHDLRRGHYVDMKVSGKTLWEILEAAGVTDPKAPRPYLDMEQLELEACMECHLQSGDESDGAC